MDDFATAVFREMEARRILRRAPAGWLHGAVYLATNFSLFWIWVLTGGGHPWFLYPILGWGIGLAAHAGVGLPARESSRTSSWMGSSAAWPRSDRKVPSRAGSRW